MITEEQTELLVERLIDRIEKANTYFLQRIGSSINRIRELTPSEAQQLVQILKYGGSYDDIIRELSRYTNMNIQDIDKIFSNYAKKDTQFAKQFYEYRNIPYTSFEQNQALMGQINALSNIAKNEMYNFTRSNVLGYSIRDVNGKVRFVGLRETYNRVLDEALLNVGQGKATFDSAMASIMRDIGGSGLKTVDFESGRSMRLDSKVRMDLKARLRELHNELQQQYGREFDSDGIEISVHGNPAPDHAPVQGRQFSNEEFEKLQSGDNAKDYKGITYNLDHDAKNGYRPISEMNCYHYVFSIVLGVNKPKYSDKQLQEIIDKSNEKVKIDGKEYTRYECSQLQRNLERKIREQKDIQILGKSSGNNELIASSQEKITQLTNKYKEISDVSGLPTKAQRLRVSGYKRTKTSKPKINNYKEIEYARKNNQIWHSTESLEEIIKSNKIISPSIAVGKSINKDVKYGTQFIEFKPELLENVNKNTILYKDDGGNAFSGRNGKFNSLIETLKDNPKYYNELKFNKDLESVKYIKKVYVRQDEPKEVINLLKDNNIDYEIYYDYRIRGLKKKR